MTSCHTWRNLVIPPALSTQGKEILMSLDLGRECAAGAKKLELLLQRLRKILFACVLHPKSRSHMMRARGLTA